MRQRYSMRTARGFNGIFLIVAGVLVGSLACAYWAGLTALQMTEEIRKRESVITHLQELLSTLKDAETGQRGFLLTGNEDYLDPYDNALPRVGQILDFLGETSGRADLQPDALPKLETNIRLKIKEIKETIDLMRSGGPRAALGVMQQNLGMRLMDSIREQAADLIDGQRSELSRAQLRFRQATAVRNGVFVGATLINLLFLGWAYRKIRREMDSCSIAALETGRQKETLEVTLASIGDAVIITDVGGCITYLNAVAEKLTGWALREAYGKPCSLVFRILNEDTRASVDSPVDKVLEKGTVVGLANHTLLIRKDGTELAIDDSGAPIREPDGHIRGVVLVFRDFTKYRETESDLRRAKEELESAVKAKDDFLATLSHELRTPLTPVLATLTSWEAHGAASPALLSDIRMLRRNLELETRLIDDLLDLTRIHRGKLSLKIAALDLNLLLEEVLSTHRAEIAHKNIRLSFRKRAAQHHVRADSARLQQVFSNILRNAIKFTPADGIIEVITANASEGKIDVTITDSGRGMSSGILERLFVPFEQGPDEGGGRPEGLGLGMAISRKLVDAHGGTISAASIGAGAGSTFVVSLPTTTPPPIPASGGASSTPEIPNAGARPLRILLVEDHEDTATVIERVLSGFGHVVESRSSVAGALDSLREGKFDLLISDIGLPDGSGTDLIREVRKFSNLPAVALTGYGMQEDIALCREAGFDDHLIKPIDFSQLQDVIAAAMSR